MDQSSQDDILVGVRPPPVTPEDAVSLKSSQDKRAKRSSEAPVAREGSPISERSERIISRAPCECIAERSEAMA
jgi:hypothetical protein